MRGLCVLWLVALLASCTTTPPSTQRPPPADRLGYARAALPFEVFGKIGMPRGSANLRWRQQGEAFELRFWGPFGTGVAEIHGTPEHVRFVRGDVQREGEPSQILSAELGWKIPVAALAYWIRGLQAPAWPSGEERVLASGGRAFDQAGWTIAIERYARQPDGGELPERLVATGPEGRFVIAVQSWRVGAAVSAADPTP